MNPADRLRIASILDAALSMDEPEREGYLQVKVAEFPVLRAVLDGIGPAGTFLRNFSAPDDDEAPAEAEEAERAGEAAAPFAGNERFQVIRVLGSGGFGDVYEVWDRTLAINIALKVVRNVRPEVIASFKRGFRALERLSHRNVCQVYELIFDDGSGAWLLSMELIRGEPLGHYLAARAGEIRSVFRQVSEGLHALHQRDVLHCDVKPSNVLVTAEGRAVILDFGWTLRREDMLSSPGSALAITLGYAAPELGHGSPHTKASDWFATGEMLRRVLEHDPDAVKAHRLSDLASLAVWLTERDPRQRPSEEEALAVLAPGLRLEPAKPRENFVGRRECLTRLGDAFAVSAGEQRCVTVHVTGESGIGKTVLVREAIRRIRLRNTGCVCSRRSSIRENRRLSKPWTRWPVRRSSI
ncbi:MAG: serine/threonine-protein kinase [Bryobacteraceae bacterium]